MDPHNSISQYSVSSFSSSAPGYTAFFIVGPCLASTINRSNQWNLRAVLVRIKVQNDAMEFILAIMVTLYLQLQDFCTSASPRVWTLILFIVYECWLWTPDFSQASLPQYQHGDQSLGKMCHMLHCISGGHWNFQSCLSSSRMMTVMLKANLLGDYWPQHRKYS